jgi:hypothetical protein
MSKGVYSKKKKKKKKKKNVLDLLMIIVVYQKLSGISICMMKHQQKLDWKLDLHRFCYGYQKCMCIQSLTPNALCNHNLVVNNSL